MESLTEAHVTTAAATMAADTTGTSRMGRGDTAKEARTSNLHGIGMAMKGQVRVVIRTGADQTGMTDISGVVMMTESTAGMSQGIKSNEVHSVEILAGMTVQWHKLPVVQKRCCIDMQESYKSVQIFAGHLQS